MRNKLHTALHLLMKCFDEITVEVAQQLNYTIDHTLGQRMQTLVVGMLQDNSLLPEGI